VRKGEIQGGGSGGGGAGSIALGSARAAAASYRGRDAAGTRLGHCAVGQWGRGSPPSGMMPKPMPLGWGSSARRCQRRGRRHGCGPGASDAARRHARSSGREVQHISSGGRAAASEQKCAAAAPAAQHRRLPAAHGARWFSALLHGRPPARRKRERERGEERNGGRGSERQRRVCRPTRALPRTRACATPCTDARRSRAAAGG